MPNGISEARRHPRGRFQKSVLVSAAAVCLLVACILSFCFGAILYCAHHNRERLPVSLMWDLKVYEAIQAGDTNYAMALVGTSLIASRRTLLELEESSKNIAFIKNQSQFPEEARQMVFKKIDEIHRAFPLEGVSSKATGAIIILQPLEELEQNP